MKDDTILFGKPYTGDPKLDRLMGMVFALAGEVAVLKGQVMRMSGEQADISSEMQNFAREVLTPLVDPDPKHQA